LRVKQQLAVVWASLQIVDRSSMSRCSQLNSVVPWAWKSSHRIVIGVREQRQGWRVNDFHHSNGRGVSIVQICRDPWSKLLQQQDNKRVRAGIDRHKSIAITSFRCICVQWKALPRMHTQIAGVE
jgi:hypothetical protein